MNARTAYFVILSLAVVTLLVLIFELILFPKTINVEINELKHKVATLQREATLSTEKANTSHTAFVGTVTAQQVIFTATVQALTSKADQISLTVTSVGRTATPMTAAVKSLESTATAMAENYTEVTLLATLVSNDATRASDSLNLIAATATSVAATATARAPSTVKVKEAESVNLFNDELTITLEGYSSIISSKITFNTRGLESARQTFSSVDVGDVVFYEGRQKYTIRVTDKVEEEGSLVVEFVVAVN